MKNGTVYIALPARLVDFYNLEQSSALDRAFDPASSCLIVPMDPDVDLFGESDD